MNDDKTLYEVHTICEFDKAETDTTVHLWIHIQTIEVKLHDDHLQVQCMCLTTIQCIVRNCLIDIPSSIQYTGPVGQLLRFYSYCHGSNHENLKIVLHKSAVVTPDRSLDSLSIEGRAGHSGETLKETLCERNCIIAEFSLMTNLAA